MKVLFIAIVVGLISLLALSGCVNNSDNTNKQMQNISKNITQNNTLQQNDNQITQELNELGQTDSDNNSSEISQIDSDLNELDSILESDKNPLADLN